MHRLVLWLVTAVGVLLCTTLGGYAEQISGRVVGVSDGDTLTVLTPDQKRVRIRLAEIDAPEKGQPFAQKSKQLLSDLVYGKTISVTTRGDDQYGRTLGRVYVSGTNVNEEMVHLPDQSFFKP